MAGGMAGKLCVVTGSNTGIGRVIAEELAFRGATVIMACRSKERTEPVAAAIRTKTGNQQVQFQHLDLSRLASVHQFSSQLKGKPVDVLINNAGLMASTREVTGDGFETTWQVNTLAPFLLTRLLLPNLKESAKRAANAAGSARVIYVGSRLEKTGSLKDLETVEDPMKRFLAEGDGKFSTFPAYGTSKLAATSLTYELARRLKAEGAAGISVQVCTPGMVNTELSRFAPLILRAISWPLRAMLLRSPQKGAETPVWLATSDDDAAKTSGKYFYDCKELDSSPASKDAALAKILWDTIEAQAPA